MNSPYKIAVISDIHDAAACKIPKRRGDLGRALLSTTVEHLNRAIHPDAVLVLGDLVDDPAAADASERLAALKQIIDRLEAPTIVIPGNHDPAPERFYQVFERPPETVDVNGLRLLPFIDPEQPGYNACRTPADLDRMLAARQEHPGPIVAAHHVPLLPPGVRCPYGYTNAEAVIAVAEEARIALSVGGHYHAGTDVVEHRDSRFLCVKALCEPPFVFTVVEIGDAGVTAAVHRVEVGAESDAR